MINLFKVHGSQNHFFILDQTQFEHELSDAELKILRKRLPIHKLDCFTEQMAF